MALLTKVTLATALPTARTLAGELAKLAREAGPMPGVEAIQSGLGRVEARIARSLEEVDAAEWNALPGAECPFLRHDFLLALETTGCATPATGWDAHHVLLRSGDGRLVGALPLYLKSHSWGEFVFDFPWADAFHRAGLPYYPRLVSAVPFTPATGPRLLAEGEPARSALLEAARDHARSVGAARMTLSTAVDNSAAHALYVRAGWERDAQFHTYTIGVD